jgi:hypothetical protein
VKERRVLQWGYKGATRVLQKRYKGATTVSQLHHEGVTSVLPAGTEVGGGEEARKLDRLGGEPTVLQGCC